MNDKVADINRESLLNRVLRDHALVAMMLFLSVLTLANGVIIGVTVAVMSMQSEKIDVLQRAYEANSAWQARLTGAVEARGIEVPTKEK